MKTKIMRFGLWIVGIIFTIIFTFGVKTQMNLIIPMVIFVYLLKDKIKNYLIRFSLRTSFIGSGLVFGLLTEVFAIWSNITVPLKERALLNPYPLPDLILAFFWYGLFVVVWYFLLKKYNYTKKEIFLLAGMYGLVFEQKGIFLLNMFTSLGGLIIGLFIMAVYAIFPILAYMITEHRFPVRKNSLFLVRWLVALLALLSHDVIWWVCGLIYYPILQKLGLLIL